MESNNKLNGHLPQVKKVKFSSFQLFAKQVNRFKYLYLGCVLLSLVAAFLINRYTRPIYMVQASVLVQETGSGNANPGAMLTEQGQSQSMDMGMDKSREIALLTSSSFVHRVLKSLDFRVSYFREGNFGVGEIYENLPFVVSLPDTASIAKIEGKTFKISFPDKEHFLLREINKNNDADPSRTFPVGKSIRLNNCSVLISLTPAFNLNTDIKEEFEFAVNDLNSLASTLKYDISIFQEDPKSSIFPSLYKSSSSDNLSFKEYRSRTTITKGESSRFR